MTLRDHVKLFRREFNEDFDIPDRSMVRVLHNFLTECCKVGSMLLARWLEEIGLARRCDIQLVANAEVAGGGTHAWLKVVDITVDVTYGQFSRRKDEIVVARHSQWHDRLRGAIFYRWEEFMVMNARYERDFEAFYHQLSSRLKKRLTKQ